MADKQRAEEIIERAEPLSDTEREELVEIRTELPRDAESSQLAAKIGNTLRLDRLRVLVNDEIDRPHTDDPAELAHVIHNDEILTLYVEGGDVPRYLACTSEGSGESSYRDNPDFFAGTADEVGEWAAGSFNEGWALNWIVDLDADESVNWSTTVFISDSSTREILAEIAQGVPKVDEWRSAADFMETVPGLLDRAGVSRPDHYPEDWQ